jgi:hypothetical protein
LGAAALAMALAATSAAAGDMQVRFEVPAPFRVGSHSYSKGVIAVHSIMAYSPTQSLLEVWVNDDCLGMMTASRSSAEDKPLRNEAMFTRDGDGRLVMTGYRMTGRANGTTYRFVDPVTLPVGEAGTAVASASSSSF